jgi:nucleotide-binding universal stress UspA family protein
MSELNRAVGGSKIAIWAVDPFERETRPGHAVIEELKNWAAATGMRIQPIHILYSPSADVPDDERGSWVMNYVPAVAKEVTQYLTEVGLSGTLEPKVLVQRHGSTGAAVEILLQYAKDVQAEWLLVSSKGRSGLRRIALGSFAESLLVKSPLPVWVFGHGAPATLNPRRILFATDFSTASKAAFTQLLQQASALKAEVTLFHCSTLPDALVLSATGMGAANVFPVDDYLKEQLAWANECAAEWSASARTNGVEVHLVIKSAALNIPGAILAEAASLHAGVIALASTSGMLGAALLGSNARQVIRQSECAVWVFGPQWLKRFARVPKSVEEISDAAAAGR